MGKGHRVPILMVGDGHAMLCPSSADFIFNCTFLLSFVAIHIQTFLSLSDRRCIGDRQKVRGDRRSTLNPQHQEDPFVVLIKRCSVMISKFWRGLVVYQCVGDMYRKLLSIEFVIEILTTSYTCTCWTSDALLAIAS